MAAVEPETAFFGGAFSFMAVFGLVVVAMIAMIVWSIVAAKKRKDAIAATVARLGLHYVAADPSLVTRFSGEPFGQGDRRRAVDVVSGNLRGVDFVTFAYSYDTTTRDAEGHSSTTTHHFQVTWVPLSGAAPHVRITPDNPIMRALGGLVGHDVNTESAEFNKVWRVRADDPRQAHAVLAPTVIARLLEADAWGRMFVLQGPALVTVKQEISQLADLEQVVAMLGDLRAKIPPFVYGG